MSGLRIGFIGAGNMAQAMARGFISAQITPPQSIIASSPVQDKHLLDVMAGMGCDTTHNNAEVTKESDVIFLSVKPNLVSTVLADVKHSISAEKPLVTSFAIGVSIKCMERELPEGSRVIRILPNTPALVNNGASVFAKGKHATNDDASLTMRFLKSVGDCDEVPEIYLDAISGLSGAGPAYMYLVLEALADGGVKMGLPRLLSIKLAAQTMLGAARMVQCTGKQPGQLKDEVCSPGGCTIEGVAALENGALRAALINAVTESTKKSKLISDLN